VKQKELNKRINSHKAWLEGTGWFNGESLSLYTKCMNNLDFSGNDLRQSRFNWSQAYNCNFSNTNLKRALLTHSEFFNSDFSFADLAFVHIEHCHFSGVNLSYANIVGPSICFGYSSFNEVNIYGAKFDEDTIPIVKEVASDVFYLDYFVVRASHGENYYYIVPADGEPLGDVFDIKNETLKRLLLKNIDKVMVSKESSYRWIILQKENISDIEGYLQYYRELFKSS